MGMGWYEVFLLWMWMSLRGTYGAQDVLSPSVTVAQGEYGYLWLSWAAGKVAWHLRIRSAVLGLVHRCRSGLQCHLQVHFPSRFEQVMVFKFLCVFGWWYFPGGHFVWEVHEHGFCADTGFCFPGASLLLFRNIYWLGLCVRRQGRWFVWKFCAGDIPEIFWGLWGRFGRNSGGTGGSVS